MFVCLVSDKYHFIIFLISRNLNHHTTREIHFYDLNQRNLVAEVSTNNVITNYGQGNTPSTFFHMIVEWNSLSFVTQLRHTRSACTWYPLIVIFRPMLWISHGKDYFYLMVLVIPPCVKPQFVRFNNLKLRIAETYFWYLFSESVDGLSS